MRLQTFGDKYFGVKSGTSVIPCKLALIGDVNISAIMSIVCTYDPYDDKLPVAYEPVVGEHRLIFIFQNTMYLYYNI